MAPLKGYLNPHCYIVKIKLTYPSYLSLGDSWTSSEQNNNIHSNKRKLGNWYRVRTFKVFPSFPWQIIHISVKYIQWNFCLSWYTMKIDSYFFLIVIKFSMTFNNSTQNSMTFQAWKAKKQNSMTFQVFQDQYEPCDVSLFVRGFFVFPSWIKTKYIKGMVRKPIVLCLLLALEVEPALTVHNVGLIFIQNWKTRKHIKLCLWYYAKEHANIYLKSLTVSNQQAK